MTMRLSTLALSSAIALAAHAASNVVPTPTRSACRATLSQADARLLAAATPNARAFQQNLHASLSTAIERSNATNVAVRVQATTPDHGKQEVGVYTVNLRSGRVTDDDQEPADDRETGAVRQRLIAKHCH
ncbi:hypothetical protein Terro_0452 [Terriglobus roseus DSM 18391]|uniref:PepSY domain-containing protein n=1 Tax=Terriglobus roseus (strain DSM 18391 / NRRL B-41598 / KBS 63) TaxID=926566 RepID=I3ZC27_TERRK|nr:hypothetical protein [Terriglobus roseus]AFL86795.1 hypothetical protein Terro_0452 [Terriglobus roseus DSM 18391]